MKKRKHLLFFAGLNQTSITQASPTENSHIITTSLFFGIGGIVLGFIFFFLVMKLIKMFKSPKEKTVDESNGGYDIHDGFQIENQPGNEYTRNNSSGPIMFYRELDEEYEDVNENVLQGEIQGKEISTRHLPLTCSKNT